MTSLRQIVDQYDRSWGRVFDLFIQSLIVFSMVTFSIETLPDLSESSRRFLSIAEVITVRIFTAEYVLRLFLAEKKLAFIFSFFGIVDLLSILPFYIGGAVDLRSIRAFRLFRLFRTLKLFRYSKAIRRFHRALLIAREEILLFGMVAMLLIFFAGVGIYYFENEMQPKEFASVFHGLWWAVCTLTTVGYGDVYPKTLGGKLFTFVVLSVGLGIISVPAGLVASALSKARQMDEEEAEAIPE